MVARAWLLRVLCCTMTRRLQSCTDGNCAHPPKGGKECRYKKAATVKAVSSGCTAEEWLLYLDEAVIAADSIAYLGQSDSDDTGDPLKGSEVQSTMDHDLTC